MITEEERRTAGIAQAVPAPRVVLHPGGFAARRWRTEQYWKPAETLRGCGFGIVFTGSASEEEHFFRVLSVKSPLPEGMAQPHGRDITGINGSHRGKQCSGVRRHRTRTHRRSVRVLNISSFDPRRNNLPARWQPLGTGVVLRPEVPTCEKCIYEACPYWDCLDRITVDTVVQHVREVTSRSFPLRVVHV